MSDRTRKLERLLRVRALEETVAAAALAAEVDRARRCALARQSALEQSAASIAARNRLLGGAGQGEAMGWRELEAYGAAFRGTAAGLSQDLTRLESHVVEARAAYLERYREKQKMETLYRASVETERAERGRREAAALDELHRMRMHLRSRGLAVRKR